MIPDPRCLTLVTTRFGGGSELMATDGQGDGIFAMLDIYWRYVVAISG